MKRLLFLILGEPCLLLAEDTAFFESKIRPVLVKHCYECHSAESGKSKGGLVLDTKYGLREGGETGPAVVPGDPSKSLLLMAIKHIDPDLEMPPKAPQLPKEVTADVETWIQSGAPDPRETVEKGVERPPVDAESARKFWAYQKPVKVEGTVDSLIRAKLKENGLSPAARAEPRVLIRRLYFDLLGLPPPELTDVSEYEALVDKLLNSPRFGERWGRHWLDVARYAESNGRESNLTFPHAWRYRDYVIDALNADIPFDRFITEQIAGDLLPAKDDAERARLLTATGFLALGAKGLNEQNKEQFAADVADEQLDTVTRAVMASSIACARCHDHKTEPFSMEDYYGMVGIFKSTQTFYGNWIDSENNNHGHLIRLPEIAGQTIVGKPLPEARVKQLRADLTKLNAEDQAQKDYIAKAQAEGRGLSGEFNKLLGDALRILWTRGGVEGALERVDETGHPRPLCMGVQEGRVHDSMLYERGEIAHPGKVVPRGFPRWIAFEGTLPKEQSGRLELAQWLTSRENPLTARVMVNRVWRHLFGAGLVRTVDHFGFTGERPSHPELLDHLAVTFMDGGWSVKKLIKAMVMTETYRQGSGGVEEKGSGGVEEKGSGGVMEKGGGGVVEKGSGGVMEKGGGGRHSNTPAFQNSAANADPDNRLLAHANKRRLEAEVIRDSMLAVSGLLDTSRRPGSLVAEQDGQSVSLMGFNANLPKDLDGSRHRSIYLPVVRDHLPDVLEQFDVANPSLVTGDRDVTNVPLQALYLLNGPFVQQQAEALAKRIASAPHPIERAFQLCFNRRPDEQEVALAERFLLTPAAGDSKLMAAFCQALLASAEFRFVD